MQSSSCKAELLFSQFHVWCMNAGHKKNPFYCVAISHDFLFSAAFCSCPIAQYGPSVVSRFSAHRVSPSEPAVRPRHAHDAHTLGIPHAELLTPTLLRRTMRHPRRVIPSILPAAPATPDAGTVVLLCNVGTSYALGRFHPARSHAQLEDYSASVPNAKCCGARASLLQVSAAVDTYATWPQSMLATFLDLDCCCLVCTMVHRPLFAAVVRLGL